MKLKETRFIKFTIQAQPKPNKPANKYGLEYYYDDGVCKACGKRHTHTCVVDGLPNICESCYEWLYRYLAMARRDNKEDTYRLLYLQSLSAEQIQKAIRCAQARASGIGEMAGTETILLGILKILFG